MVVDRVFMDFFAAKKKLPSNLRRDKNEKLPCQE